MERTWGQADGHGQEMEEMDTHRRWTRTGDEHGRTWTWRGDGHGGHGQEMEAGWWRGLVARTWRGGVVLDEGKPLQQQVHVDVVHVRLTPMTSKTPMTPRQSRRPTTERLKDVSHVRTRTRDPTKTKTGSHLVAAEDQHGRRCFLQAPAWHSSLLVSAGLC